MTPQLRQNVVSEALTWLNTPYHHQGDLKGVGVDCVMVMIEVYKACGLVPSTLDPRPYTHDWHMHRSEENYLAGVMDLAERVDEPQPGDIALFTFGRCVSHGGIVIKWPVIIHAYIEHGAVVLTDVSKSAALLARLHGFYSLR
ncbi:C40 family peptidase [Duganella sp. Root336D2]|uniref:C40 family peptidase n=1 Tax=Duganella sp. Root336D2 TaxID=1736518 RepID=UPI0006FA2095|nr:NlpC/P60 family protein [Duganella sp. Root336D2]KQV51362.1 hydrolase [Duganella sp. Root336D2]